MDKSTNQQSLVEHTAPTQSRQLTSILVVVVYGVACVKVGIDVSSLVEEGGKGGSLQSDLYVVQDGLIRLELLQLYKYAHRMLNSVVVDINFTGGGIFFPLLFVRLKSI
ncbi:hypothetical protein T05_4254 [Trichinella murrelli]|uniref:Uncharacterized protein n=1 Tax=Trichinella murrelli TaxID=144512 RepID=A0A0V0TS85_9BILA|nr:hypothetical protein T05_4254 [Trichinella murrelli]